MARKKKQDFLAYPKSHYKFNDEAVEQALLAKSRDFLGTGEQNLNFILISGQFYDTRGWAYSSVRSWKGAIRPGENTNKKSLLDATFACMSVYLSSLISFQADFTFAFDEIKTI